MKLLFLTLVFLVQYLIKYNGKLKWFLIMLTMLRLFVSIDCIHTIFQFIRYIVFS